MAVKILTTEKKSSMEPLTCTRPIGECPVAGKTLQEIQLQRLAGAAKQITIQGDFWPSANCAEKLVQATEDLLVKDENGRILAWIADDETTPYTTNIMPLDDDSMVITYPWDILTINEEIVEALNENRIEGTVRDGVYIDGFVEIGEGTVLLPGVYIEGNVMIGKNCKIGPNCYFRGNTVVGDNCHVGQAVEIKNSILMDNTGAGHLSYIGDSIIGANSNCGAGTITANFRHDGKNHRSAVDGKIIDTGRRKFGTIFGDDVHTGIHTSIYPGRKIWPHMSTLPGDVVKKDIQP